MKKISDSDSVDLFFYYMVNYGWLFVFLMVGLVIFGFFGFNKFGLWGSNYCNLATDFQCSKVSYQDGMSFNLMNSQPTSVAITSITFSQGNDKEVFNIKEPSVMNPGSTQLFVIKVPDKKVIEGQIEVIYKSVDSGLEHKKLGEIRLIRR